MIRGSRRPSRWISTAFAALSLSSCVTTYSHMMPSEIDGGAVAVVSAEATAFNVLDLMSVDAKIRNRLMRECETGRVSGIETVLTDRVFYLCYPTFYCIPAGDPYSFVVPLFRYYQVRATGLCSVRHRSTPSEKDSQSEWE